MKKFQQVFITAAISICLFSLASGLSAQSWSYVGTSGISDLNPTASQSRIFFDANGVMHVGYIKGTSYSVITIRKFDAGVWSTVAQHALNRVAVETDYAIDGNGDIYFAYQASFSSQRMYRVKKYSGGSWSFIGDSIVSYNTTKVDLELINSDIYLMGNRTVYKWNSAGSAWDAIHGAPSGSQYTNGVLVQDNSSTLYILNCYNELFSTNYYLKLQSYSGGSWSDVGDTVPVPNALYLHLMFNNSNEPYIAFLTSAGLTPNHNIIHWNGADWVDVGDLSTTPNASVFSATLNSMGNPMFTSADYGGNVYEFNGSTYERLDSATVSGPIIQIYDLEIDPIDGTIYILINELNSGMTGSVLSVMKYTGTVGIGEIKDSEPVISPNPACDLVQITNLREGALLKITDLHGRIIYQEITSGTDVVTDVSFLPNGIYLIRVENAGKVMSKKLLVNK